MLLYITNILNNYFKFVILFLLAIRQNQTKKLPGNRKNAEYNKADNWSFLRKE